MGAALIASCSSPPTSQQAGHIALSVSDTATGSCGHHRAAQGLIAETRSGKVVQIDASTLAIHTVATGTVPHGGVAQRTAWNQLYATASGANGLPSIWEVPLATCRPQARLVETRAELPSVSPDGGYLGYVTVDGRGRQTGVSIVRLAENGEPTGDVQRLAAATLPPPLPIRGIAVGVNDRTLAVWGGFVDPYLGRHHPTVGTLEPAASRSLRSLAAVFDAQGISIPARPGRTVQSPKAWQAAPSYLANGEFLVWNVGDEIVMPFTVQTPGESGGGFRNIERVSGEVVSLAAGPDGELAWVGPGGNLEIATGAIDLPFGPAANAPPPTSPPVLRRVKGGYSSLAWSTGTSPQSRTPPPVFTVIDHLPNVVGLTEAKAEMVMAHLALPVFVGHRTADANVPPGTVIAQDPPAGAGVACQCSITLTVATQT